MKKAPRMLTPKKTAQIVSLTVTVAVSIWQARTPEHDWRADLFAERVESKTADDSTELASSSTESVC